MWIRSWRRARAAKASIAPPTTLVVVVAQAMRFHGLDRYHLFVPPMIDHLDETIYRDANVAVCRIQHYDVTNVTIVR
jgi:hypothetical protein